MTTTFPPANRLTARVSILALGSFESAHQCNKPTVHAIRRRFQCAVLPDETYVRVLSKCFAGTGATTTNNVLFILRFSANGTLGCLSLPRSARTSLCRFVIPQVLIVMKTPTHSDIREINGCATMQHTKKPVTFVSTLMLSANELSDPVPVPIPSRLSKRRKAASTGFSSSQQITKEWSSQNYPFPMQDLVTQPLSRRLRRLNFVGSIAFYQ